MSLNFSKPFIKERVINLIRSFFNRRKYHEIDTPILLPSLPLEPGLFTFQTTWHPRNQKLFLAPSPESSLKKLIALGIGNCYAISKVCRDLENIGLIHNLEFLLLEWYQIGKNYRHIARTTENLISYIYQQLNKINNNRASLLLNYRNLKIDLSPPWYRLSLNDLFVKYSNIDLSQNLTDSDLFSIAAQKGYSTSGATWESLFDQILINEIESRLPQDKPVFVFDYPTRLSPLCQPCKHLPGFSERFELYIAGMEIGNAYTELTDADILEKNFQNEQRYRQDNHLPTHPYDQELVDSTRHFPACTGIAIGVDRLAMLFANAASIDEVLYFPTSKLIK